MKGDLLIDFAEIRKQEEKQAAKAYADGNMLVRAACRKLYGEYDTLRIVGRMKSRMKEGERFDCLFACSGEPASPDEVFRKLRWGGIFAYVGSNYQKVVRQAEMYEGRNGFILEGVPSKINGQLPLLPEWLAGVLPIKRGYWFVARKVHLIQQNEITERFTYCVQLTRAASQPEGYVVTKHVPPFDNIVHRLRHRFPNASQEDIENRARKFVTDVFPTFLTREAAFLKILEESLPMQYRNRVPRLLGVARDQRGFVTTLHMNWLRTGRRTISQLDFAMQSAELLSALHDHAKVIHLDLRLDNFVITDQGVGFVDFGSAVRIGEDIQQNRMLTSLFTEMMRTSQIQRMLGRMIDEGHVTNEEYRSAHRKVDKAADSYYLAVQINKPTVNPEFGHLIRYEKEGAEAKAIRALTAAILRPKHPGRKEFKTATDILRGLRRIEQRLSEGKVGGQSYNEKGDDSWKRVDSELNIV